MIFTLIERGPASVRRNFGMLRSFDFSDGERSLPIYILVNDRLREAVMPKTNRSRDVLINSPLAVSIVYRSYQLTRAGHPLTGAELTAWLADARLLAVQLEPLGRTTVHVQGCHDPPSTETVPMP